MNEYSQVEKILKRYLPENLANLFNRACIYAEITRLSRITKLDKTNVETWSACRPKAFMWQVSAGKGLTKQSAIITAIMEALEGYVCESYLSSYQLEEVFKPENPIKLIQLERESQKLLGITPIIDKDKLVWIQAKEIKSGENVNVPLYWAYLSNNASKYGLVTNGLSGGLTKESVISHGVCELIERHYISSLFEKGTASKDSVMKIDLTSIILSLEQSINYLDQNILNINFLMMKTSKVPTIWCIIFDESPLSPNLSVNFGSKSSKSLKDAIIGSFTEACQQRASQIQGAREDLSNQIIIPGLDKLKKLKYFINSLETINFEDIECKSDLNLVECIPGPIYQIPIFSKLSGLDQLFFYKHIAPRALFKQDLF